MTEIIAYRNPLEAAIWNAMANGGVVVFFVVLLLGALWVTTYIAVEYMTTRPSTMQVIATRGRRLLTPGRVATVVTLIAITAIHWYNLS